VQVSVPVIPAAVSSMAVSPMAVSPMARRVLVVDDEENIRFLLQTALSHAGYEVVTAETGFSAVDRYHNESPDLVLLDVMLPDFDGFEVLRRLRANGPTCPVIFLTAKDTTADQVRGLTLGGDDYVAKPFSLEALLARVAVQFRRTGKSTDDGVLRYADLVLDTDAHRVERDGEAISLSATEFKVLRYLLANAERVLTKDQILDHVWRYDFDGETNIVENYISLTRKKVDSGRSPLIKTIRGVGYTLRKD
jgi:two-component system, OmpR family, response regulator